MKIEIMSDVFDIVKRVKEIDKDYYIIFDTSKYEFELHHKKQPNTYCFKYIYENLDNRLIDMIHGSTVRHIDKIIEDIDKNNTKIENEINNNRLDLTEYMVREIYDYSNNSSKDYSNNAFETVWS